MSVLRRAYVEVLPDTKGFDPELTKQLRAADSGGKAGKQIGGQLNRALSRFNLDAIDVKADPKSALAAIDLTERRLRELGRDAATVEVKVRTEKALGELARFRKQLGDVGENGAEGFAAKISQQLASLPMTGLLSVPVVAAGAAAAPLLAAAISGAIIGGAGIGGVVGGLVVASKDTRVQAAEKQLADDLQARLQLAAGAFVQPAIKGVHQIEAALDTVDLRGIFQDSAKFVDPLAHSVSNLIADLGDGIEDLVANAGPVIDVISTGISNIGETLGAGLSGIAQNSDTAAAGLQTLLGVVNSAAKSTFGLVEILTELYGVSQKIGGDFVLQTFLKLTGAQMDNTGFSAHKAGAATADMGDQMQIAADKSAQLAKQQADLKVYTDAVKASQDGLKSSLESLGGATSHQGQLASALQTAMDNLYGAAIRNTDANEAYQASVDSLSTAVGTNGHSLNINTAAGRANRDALEGLLTSNGELYISNVAAGVSEDNARKKHDARTEAIRKEAAKLGLNKAATQDLIDTYGKIPKAKTTDLLLKGVNSIAQALKDLYVFQRSLADGIPVASEIAKLNEKAGPAHRYGGYADGGQIGGWSPNSKADNIPALLTAKEWVHPVDAVNYYGPQVMSAIQKRQVPREVLAGFSSGALAKLGDLPIFATGGQVAPIDTSRRWPFTATMAHTRVPSKAEVAAKVPIGAGPGGAFARSQNGKPYIWADAGPDGYDCSGIVSAVYNVLHGRNPYSHTFSTSSLPGSWFPKPGIGGPLTAAWSNPGESPASSTTGHMMGMVNGLTFESSGGRGVHLGGSTRRLTDFAHIGHYNQGGQVPFGSYDRGGYLPTGLSLAHNGTGRPERVGGGDTFNFNFSGPVGSQRQLDDMVVGAVKRAKQARKLP